MDFFTEELQIIADKINKPGPIFNVIVANESGNTVSCIFCKFEEFGYDPHSVDTARELAACKVLHHYLFWSKVVSHKELSSVFPCINVKKSIPATDLTISLEEIHEEKENHVKILKTILESNNVEYYCNVTVVLEDNKLEFKCLIEICTTPVVIGCGYGRGKTEALFNGAKDALNAFITSTSRSDN